MHLFRRLFERAAQYVAVDWNVHKLWDKWIEFESSQEDICALARVYCNVLPLPIKELPRYQQSFIEFASNHELSLLISKEELDDVETQVRFVLTQVCDAIFCDRYRPIPETLYIT